MCDLGFILDREAMLMGYTMQLPSVSPPVSHFYYSVSKCAYYRL